MPSLENLKKRAKQYLRWHRERHYPVAAEIRAALPRFGHLDDEQVLAAAFRLADAQELVARRQGFESWQALLKGLDSMNIEKDTGTATPPATPGTVSAEPMIFVADIAASLAFYTGKLGFEVAFTYGEPVFYGQVVRDAARLNLRHVDTPVIDPDRAAREELMAAAITLDDAKPLFLAYQAAGVDFHQSLRTEPWGARTFVVRDPDGNLILFAGRGE